MITLMRVVAVVLLVGCRAEQPAQALEGGQRQEKGSDRALRSQERPMRGAGDEPLRSQGELGAEHGGPGKGNGEVGAERGGPGKGNGEVGAERGEERRVRASILAGSWYEADKDALAEKVDGYLKAAEGNRAEGYAIGLIVPHAGHVYSGAVAANAFTQLGGRTYGRVFLAGPSHHAAFHGVAVTSYTHYATPLGEVPVASDVIAELAKAPLFSTNTAAEDQEHSIEIELPFLQRVLPRFQLVPMVVGSLSEDEVKQVGETLKKHIRPGDLFVASSDFTHYGQRFGYFGPPADPIASAEASVRLPALLERAWTPLAGRDLAAFFAHKRETRDTICGFLPIGLLLAVLPPDSGAHLLKTDTSGRITGDWDNSVSYLAAAYTGLWPYLGVDGTAALDEAEKAALLKLARNVVDTVVSTGHTPTPTEAGIAVSARLDEKCGAFVTLKKGDDLRGCIGTIAPVKPLVKAVSDNAVNAALHDRRFQPVAASELNDLTVEVSVLTPPAPVSGHGEIILGKHGVILEKNGRMALFLPQVAPEQGWTVDETLAHLSVKAGLPPDAWRTGASFEVFEATVFHEEK